MTTNLRTRSPRRPDRDLYELLGLKPYADDFMIAEIARERLGPAARPDRPGVRFEPEVIFHKWLVGECDLPEIRTPWGEI